MKYPADFDFWFSWKWGTINSKDRWWLYHCQKTYHSLCAHYIHDFVHHPGPKLPILCSSPYIHLLFCLYLSCHRYPVKVLVLIVSNHRSQEWRKLIPFQWNLCIKVSSWNAWSFHHKPSRLSCTTIWYCSNSELFIIDFSHQTWYSIEMFGQHFQ